MLLKDFINHPTFFLQPKIAENTEIFLNKLGFNYFQYLRCFNDGSFSLLSNNLGLFEVWEKMTHAKIPLIYSSFNSDYKNLHSYWFLWDEELPIEPVKLMREHLGLYHGLTYVRRFGKYYDMIAIAVDQPFSNINSLYMNKINAILEFVKEFDFKNRDLLTLIDKNPIIVAPEYRDINYKFMCLHKGRIVIKNDKNISYITSQEMNVLKLIFQAHSYKEISDILHISPKTIETYITRIKHRTGLNNLLYLKNLIT